MTLIELQRRNLVAALQYGLITWLEYFREWTKIHSNIESEDL